MLILSLLRRSTSLCCFLRASSLGFLIEEESCLAFFEEKVLKEFVAFDGVLIFGVVIVLGCVRTIVEVIDGVLE